MRWYDITAKLYELNSNYTPYKRPKIDSSLFYKEYSLHNLANIMELKTKVQLAQQIFRVCSERKDRKVIVKCSKLVFNSKHFSDKVYSSFIKSMR